MRRRAAAMVCSAEGTERMIAAVMPEEAKMRVVLQYAAGPALRRTLGEREMRDRLEIAVRRYVAPEARGGEVALVGVAHIGDATYYAALAELLAEYDLVLYETVAPSGANGGGGADDAERALQTQQAMRWIYQAHGLRVEPSGAIAVAAALSGRVSLAGEGDVVIVISGRNVDEDRFLAWIDADE